MKTDLFQFCGHCWVFQICWHTEWSTFTASSFRIWNSSIGIPSPPLALFVMMVPKAHLTSHSRMSGLGEWSHHRDYLGHEDLLCVCVCMCVYIYIHIHSDYIYIESDYIYIYIHTLIIYIIRVIVYIITLLYTWNQHFLNQLLFNLKIK